MTEFGVPVPIERCILKPRMPFKGAQYATRVPTTEDTHRSHMLTPKVEIFFIETAIISLTPFQSHMFGLCEAIVEQSKTTMIIIF